jgi:hypothetical protein
MGVLPIRETAGADAVTIGLAVAEGEKWCCAAACAPGAWGITVHDYRVDGTGPSTDRTHGTASVRSEWSQHVR